MCYNPRHGSKKYASKQRQVAVNRRQLALVILLNTLISVVVALTVVWAFEARRPDAEELAALPSSVGASVTAATGAVIDLPPTATAASVAPIEATPAVEETSPDAAAATEGGEETIYVVQVGDSLSGIASKYGVTLADIVAANKLDNPDVVFSGQRLIIPIDGLPAATPTVQPTGTTGLTIRSINGVGDLANEYVEIVNDTDLTFNLQGWKLQRSGGPEYTFGDLLVFPGGSVRLYSASGADTTIVRYWGQSAPVWQAGAQAVLINAQGDAVANYQVP